MPILTGPSTFRVLASSAVKVDKTGDTNETALATITIPAGSMGANGILRVTTLWTHTNNANTKTWRIRLGGISGTQFATIARTTSATDGDMRIIQNRNSQSSQVAFPSTQGVGFGSSTSGVASGSIDTSAAQDLVLSAQLGVGTDTMSLERYIVEILYKA